MYSPFTIYRTPAIHVFCVLVAPPYWSTRGCCGVVGIAVICCGVVVEVVQCG